MRIYIYVHIYALVHVYIYAYIHVLIIMIVFYILFFLSVSCSVVGQIAAVPLGKDERDLQHVKIIVYKVYCVQLCYKLYYYYLFSL